jgi:NCS1 family nucleobase:cation symporter-1
MDGLSSGLGARGDAGVVARPDGRVELTAEGEALIGQAGLANHDLAPVPLERRTWRTYSYLALWMGMAHGIPSYTLASSLIALGMAWYQAVLTIALGNLIVLIPMLLNSHAGTKYGIPYPVFVRASFGLRGANLPAMLRALVACGWFGIQTWIGGQAIFTLVGAFAGSGWLHAASLDGFPATEWVCFAIFWLLQMALILRGIEVLRRLEWWVAPLTLVGAAALLIYMVLRAHGLGPMLSQGSSLGWGGAFWPVFFPALMGVIGYFSTMALNMPDFTRFGRSQREQIVGQIAGLPTTMTAFSLLAVLITSATVVVFGKAVWDPITLIGTFSSPIVVVICLLIVMMTTLATNVAANTVGPAYDFSNLYPRRIGFRAGALITGLVAVVFQPWQLISNPHLYVFTWLDVGGSVLGAVAGVMIADYWVLRRTRLDLVGLYRPDHVSYAYRGGWNWRAVLAFAVGGLLALGGAYSAPGQGPFPQDGLIPALRPLYNYGWLVATLAALVVYIALSRLAPAAATGHDRTGLRTANLGDAV